MTTKTGVSAPAERDWKTNPVRGDEIMTRGNCVLIEDADEKNLSYRYLKSDDQWSRIFLTTVACYGEWPMQIIRRGDGGGE